MDQAVRNKLRNVVTQCRKLLEDSTAQALQGRFGIYATNNKDEIQIEDNSRMMHLTKDDRAYRKDLLIYLEHIKAIGYKPYESLEQLIREIAFTHLNRLCAYKMMEARGLIRESVSRGLRSQYFFFYLADHPEDEKLHNGGQQEVAYRNFLDWLGGTLSEEIGVLFNPNDPANRVYPPQRVLDEILMLINDGELSGIWSQDETIGWVYQYFTPKELRDKVRKESQAPRNSYELAFRNQFYTPRYVVEFLSDNTLGRIWYEMRKGKTVLKDRCRYLVKKPMEIFLAKGEEPPTESKETIGDLSQEELLKQPVYIPHRPKKDPREIKILDPACGSGHFLLYCFDLLQIIYEEAYDDPDLATALRKDYSSLGDLRREIPALILKNNLHGIDIDIRATQIAALALWLRCQKGYQELGLKNGERPKITRSNIVCAEPMPGEENMRREFIQGLDDKLRQLVALIFDHMKLAGEAGSLLKIEEEIGTAIRRIYGQYGEMFRESDEERWTKAENDLLQALRDYAERAENGYGFMRRLFVEDAARGFSFVDLCRKRFDVVLMNPPFGEFSVRTKDLANSQYRAKSHEILAAFVERGCAFKNVNGLLGSITSRTAFFAPTTSTWRQEVIVPGGLATWVELGSGVLDGAMVETCMFTIGKTGMSKAIFIRPQKADIGLCPETILPIHKNSAIYELSPSSFALLDGAPFAYWLHDRFFWCLEHLPSLSEEDILVKVGLQTGDDFRFIRLRTEIMPKDTYSIWFPHAKGGDNSPFYSDIHLVVKWQNDGSEIKRHPSVRLNMYSENNTNLHFIKGMTFSYRTHRFSPAVLPTNCITGVAGMGIFALHRNLKALLSILNSSVVNEFISARLGQLESQSLYQAGTITPTPLSPINPNELQKLGDLGGQAIDLLRQHFAHDELSPFFTIYPSQGHGDQKVAETKMIRGELLDIYGKIDEIVIHAYGFRKVRIGDITERWFGSFCSSIDVLLREGNSQSQDDLSIAVGYSFGRWDIRFATGEQKPLELSDPFDPLPICPPGMLVGLDGLPAKPEDVPSSYPIRIYWDGILVDDPEHEDDIVRRVREVLEAIWKDSAEAIEQETCEILGVRELRDYFRKPGTGGFWMDHVKRYSKSHRKAPIYWYLRSAKGNYGLWLYYHRLDKDLLFKVLLNYVEPKIRLEEDRLNTLRSRKDSVGSSGSEAKQIEKDMDHQEQFISELHDFKDKLRRTADLHLDPDVNDGVVLNIASLWELVPWNEAKEYWNELLEGKYEWSNIGKQLRGNELVSK